jgi:hypothetical protein
MAAWIEPAFFMLFAASQLPSMTDGHSADIKLVAWPVLDPSNKWAAVAIARPSGGGDLQKHEMLVLPLDGGEVEQMSRVEEQGEEQLQVRVQLLEKQQQQHWQEQVQESELHSAMPGQPCTNEQSGQGLQQQHIQQDLDQHQQWQKEQNYNINLCQGRHLLIEVCSLGLFHKSNGCKLVTEQQASRGSSSNMLLLSYVSEQSLYLVKSSAPPVSGAAKVWRRNTWWRNKSSAGMDARGGTKVSRSYSLGGVQSDLPGAAPPAEMLVLRPGGEMLGVQEPAAAGGRACVFSAVEAEPLCYLDPHGDEKLLWGNAR